MRNISDEMHFLLVDLLNYLIFLLVLFLHEPFLKIWCQYLTSLCLTPPSPIFSFSSLSPHLLYFIEAFVRCAGRSVKQRQ